MTLYIGWEEPLPVMQRRISVTESLVMWEKKDVSGTFLTEWETLLHSLLDVKTPKKGPYSLFTLLEEYSSSFCCLNDQNLLFPVRGKVALKNPCKNCKRQITALTPVWWDFPVKSISCPSNWASKPLQHGWRQPIKTRARLTLIQLH